MINQARGDADNSVEAGTLSSDVDESAASDSLFTQQSYPEQAANVPPSVRQEGDDNLPPRNTTLTHLTADGKNVHMVDVGAKNVTKRVAVAESKVVFPPEVLEAFSTTQPDEMVGPKGPIFATAKIAGIMAAK